MRTRAIRFVLVSALAFMASANLVHAQCYGSGAISLFFDPSTRSLGMGGASSPVFWGGDPDDWANPALLGYRHGIRFRYDKSQLVPGLAGDVFWSSTRITMGEWGVGFSFAGLPDHLGWGKLDYGNSLAINESQQVIGTFESWENVESFGIGINVLEFAESLLGHWTSSASLHTWGDVSLGWARKTVDVDLAPLFLVPPASSGRAGARTNDLGLLVRLTPLDTIDRDGGPGPRLDPLGGWRLDLAYSMSWRNHADASLDFGVDSPDPIARDSRIGVGVHAASGLPPAWRDRFEAKDMGWLADAFSPLLEFGLAWDRSKLTLPGDPRVDCTTEDLYGLDIVLAKVVSLRWGYVDGPHLEGPSWGLGLGFSLGDIAGVRYDHATIPQADGLKRRTSQGVSVYFDGMALARRLRS